MPNLSTDSQALQKRIETHAKYSKYEINDWITQIVKPKQGETVLDLGCGTGKQLFDFFSFIGKSGKLVGVDISQESLNYINEKCKNENITNIKTILSSMEEIENKLPQNEKYNIVLSCFALYYSKIVEKNIIYVKKHLSTNGRFFVCGPMQNNNINLINFHNNLFDNVKLKESFMESTCLGLLRKHFNQVKQFVFENPIEFTNAGAMFDYWMSYALSKNVNHEQFKREVNKYFETNDKFITKKEVLGLLAYDL